MTLSAPFSKTPTLEHITRGQVFSTAHVGLRAERCLLEGHHRPHDHTFYELALIVGGHSVHRTMQGEQTLGVGQVVVVQPGAWHAYLHCEQFEVFNLYFDEALLYRELLWTADDPTLAGLLWRGPRSLDREGVRTLELGPTQTHDLLEQFNFLEAGSGSESLKRWPSLIGHLLLILDQLGSGLAQDPLPLRTGVPSLTAKVLEAISLLEEACQYPWTLGELARQLNLNPSYLTRLFTRQVGLPPMAYLRRLRLERAAGLLAQSELQVGLLAAEVGWLDPNYFARRFRAHFGVCPSAYRARFRP